MSYHVKMVKIWKKIFLKTENEKMAWRRNQYHYILEFSLREARSFTVWGEKAKGASVKSVESIRCQSQNTEGGKGEFYVKTKPARARYGATEHAAAAPPPWSKRRRQRR